MPRNSWTDEPYCVPYDDYPHYEGWPPMPILPPQAYEWLSYAILWVNAYFRDIRADITKGLFLTLPYLAMHIVPGYVMKETRKPFIGVSERQLVKELGYTDNSRRHVRNVLMTYSLECTPANGSLYAAATLSARKAGARPLIRIVRKGDGARVSSYEILDIRPIDASRLLAAVGLSGVEGSRGSVDRGGLGAKPVASGVKLDIRNSTPASNYSILHAMASGELRPDEEPRVGRGAGDDAPGAGDESNSANSSLSPSLYDCHPSLEAGDEGRTKERAAIAYDELIKAFGTSTGTKDAQTRAAFDRLLARGYDSETIIDAARRYRASPDRHQWRYPLKALEDPAWVTAYCGRIRRRADSGWTLDAAPMARTPLRDGTGLVYGVLVKDAFGEMRDTGLTVAPSASEDDVREMLRDQRDEVLKRLHT